MTYITSLVPVSELNIVSALTKTNNISIVTPVETNPLTEGQRTSVTNFLESYSSKSILRNSSSASLLGKTEEKNETLKVLTWFVADFISELNKLIRRGGHPVNNGFEAKDRKFYNLPVGLAKLPELNSEAKVNYWAEQIIKGEQQRVDNGGTPISTPTWQIVKFWYDKLELQTAQLGTLRIVAKNAQKAVTAELKTGVEVYINGRDELEYYYRKETDEARRDIMEIWGILFKTVGGDPNVVSTVVGFVTSDGIPLEDVDVFIKSTNLNLKTRADGSITSHEVLIGETDIELTKTGYNKLVIENFMVKPYTNNLFTVLMVMTSSVEAEVEA